MSTLRARMIRLAFTNPDIRPHLLPILAKTAMSRGVTYEEFTSALMNIDLAGPRAVKVDFENGFHPVWYVTPSNHRQHRNRHDKVFWDEYASPMMYPAMKWLETTFGKGLFHVDIWGEGLVEITLTDAGRAKITPSQTSARTPHRPS